MKLGTSSMNDRLSYLQSNEDSQTSEFSSSFNPCKSLTEIFNSVCEEEIETEHLKVYLRIRPILFEENISSLDGNVEILNQRSILLTAPSNSNVFRNKPHGTTKVSHRFTFTHVYDQETSQALLFEDTTQGLVKDLVNGQNCLLFTYGATNSGKTYTIQGSTIHPGLLPRTLDVLFKTIGNHQYKGSDLRPQHFCGVLRLSEKEVCKEEDLKEQLLKTSPEAVSLSFSKSNLSCTSHLSQETEILSPCSSVNNSTHTSIADSTTKEDLIFDEFVNNASEAIYAIFVSFAEIYNEYIYDLLEKNLFCKKNKRNPLALGEDKNGAIYIKGLKEVRVRNTEEAMQVLEVGKQNLHFAATKLNHHSSRSHCIFTIKLVRLADPDYPHVARVSMLSLCDLAGAERAGKTLNSIDRLKEANNINTSLLVLGRCMAALRQNQIIARQTCGPKKQIPIPYRDSKVTRLFQSFFMGRGKVAMIVNISTSSLLFDETLKVLKFSALASKVTVTQEKPPIDQLVIERKTSNQFSRLMHHSLNMSTSSGRLSVPWSNKSFADITFGGIEEIDTTKMSSLQEEESEDERYTALLVLIEKLKEKLIKESREKNELESKLRKEICDAFGKRIVQIEDTWKSRLEEERAITDEYNDWRINHVMNSVKKSDGGRKRLRAEVASFDEEEELVPSILLAREEIKAQNLEDENAQLREELFAIKASLKASSQAAKGAQEENSRLTFQLADLTRHVDKVQKEKEELEMSYSKQYQSISSVSEDGESLELVLQKLQQKYTALQKSEEEKDQEVKNLKLLLVEAAEEFQEKENVIQNFKIQIQSAQNGNANQDGVICELENQLSEMKEMHSTQGRYLEEREQVIHELREELETLKEKVCSGNFDIKEEEEATKELVEEKDMLLAELLMLKKEVQGKMELVSEVTNLKEELEKITLIRNSDSSSSQKLMEDNKLLRVEIEQLVNGKQKLKDIIKQLKSELENMKSTIAVTDADVEEVNEECLRKEEELAELTKKCCDLNTQLKFLQQKDHDHFTECNNYVKKLEVAEQKIDELYKSKDAANSQMRTLIECNEKLSSRMKGVVEEKELLGIKIFKLESQLNSINSSDAFESRESLLEEVVRLVSVIDEKDEQISNLFTELKDLKENNPKIPRQVEELEEVVVLKEMSIKELWKELESTRALNDKQVQDFMDLKNNFDSLAIKYQSLDKEKTDLKTKLENTAATISELHSEIDNLKSDICQNENESERIDGKSLDLKDKFESLTISHKSLEEEKSNLQIQLETTNLTIEELNCKINALKSNLDEHKNESKKVKERYSDFKDKFESLTISHKSLEEEKSNLQIQLESTNLTIEELNCNINTLKLDLAKLKNESEKVKERCCDFKDKFESLTISHKSLEEEKSNLQSQLETTNLTIEELNCKINYLKSNLDEHKNESEKVKERYSDFNGKFESLTISHKSLEEEKSNLQSQLETTNLTIEELNCKINKLNLVLEGHLKNESEKICMQEKEIECLSQTKLDLISKLDDKEKEILGLTNEKELLIGQIQSLSQINEKKYSDLKDQFESFIERHKSLEVEKAKVQTQFENSTTSINELTAEIDHVKSILQQQKNEAITIAQELKEKIIIKDNELVQQSEVKDDFESKLNERINEIMCLTTEKESLLCQVETLSEANAKYVDSEQMIKKLKFTLQDLEGMNSKLEQQLQISDEQKLKLERDLEVFTNFKEENLKLKEMLASSSKKQKDLEELHFKSTNEIHSMSYVLEEKDETVSKMAAKIESLDKKVNLTEEELQPYKAKCEILEKEVAALREARNEDSNQLKLEIESKENCISLKDEEIATLQEEIKKLLQSSMSSNVTTDNEKSAHKIKEEPTVVSNLQSQLRLYEEENVLLKNQLSSLLQKHQESVQILHDSQFSSHPNELDRSSRKKSPHESSKFSEVDSALKKTPPKQCRSTRTRNTRKQIPLLSLENATPDSLRLTLEPSDSEDLDSAIKATQSTRGRRGRTIKPKYPLDSSLEDVCFKMPSSAAKIANSKTSAPLKYSISEEESDLWQPETTGKTKQTRTSKSRTKTKRQTKVYNPHLDKENNSRERTSSVDAENDLQHVTSPSSKPVRTKGRRQRTLYNVNAVEEPFECPPNLIEMNEDADSPHTAVRRMLRSKNRAK